MSQLDRPKTNPIVQILMFAGVLALLILVILLLSENKRESGNPYDLDIEGFNKINPDLITHELNQKIPIACERLYGITIDENDQIYASTDAKIHKFNRFGSELFQFDTPSPIRAMDIDESGKIYAASTRSVFRFSSTGMLEQTVVELSDSTLITSIAVSGQHVFVADAGTRVVAHYDTAGEFIGFMGGKNAAEKIPGYVIPSPFFDLAVQDQQFMWVVNPGMHQFEKYSFSGELLDRWGHHSAKIEGFCGCCNPSHFALMPDGGFVTSEKGLVRVKLYSADGQLKSVVTGPDSFAKHATGLDLAALSNGDVVVLDPGSKSLKIYSQKVKLNSNE